MPLVDRFDSTGPRQAALILSPTRELTQQIVDELHSIAHAKALRVAPVYGGVGIQAQATRAAKAHIIVATPGRLEGLMERGAVSRK